MIAPSHGGGAVDQAAAPEGLSTIWTYWETPPGKEEPPHITLAHECLRRNCGDTMAVRVVRPEHLEALDLDLHPNWRKLRKPAHRADYLRVALLYRYGGFWVDSDIITIRSFEPVRDLLAQHDFVAWEYRSGTDRKQMTWRTPVGAFGVRPQSPLMGRWLDQINDLVASSDVDRAHTWHRLGRKTMNPLLKELVTAGQLDYFPIVAESTIAPIKAKARDRFLEVDSLRRLIKDDPLQPFVFYFNSWMPSVQTLSREEILRGSNVFCRLFQYAMFPDRRAALLEGG